MKKLIKILLLTIFVTSGIMLAGCSKQERKVEEKKRLTLELVTLVPVGDSDKPVQLVKDSETGMEYFIYNGNMTPRLGDKISYMRWEEKNMSEISN
ncbi:hypothetical protein BG262_02765 [Floricoccus penangensis]|uniref:Uncharacterized protein n=1 Tax=Floricoccus penangensis TaxID=1859475 RepID=A0A9Q5JG56_9LACT|nr:hypothetical protein [Floricoccus penangensis]OFI46738.1 hypothetical protein BG262_02765 [Floricoccus penangensis]